MWTYTAYILWKFFQGDTTGRQQLDFENFAKFIFNVMWQQNNLVFHDGKSDLYQDLKYLKTLEVLDFAETAKLEKTKIKVKDRDKLRQVAEIVENSANLTRVELIEDYKHRIDKAVKEAKDLLITA